MTAPAIPPWALRLLGLVTLFVALSGMASTLWTLLALTVGTALAVVAQRAGGAFGWFLLLVNVADLVAYGALVGVSIALLRLREFRVPGQILGAYCVVMGLLQPGMEYMFLVRPGRRLAAAPWGAVTGFADMLAVGWGAGLLVAYGAVLFWAGRRHTLVRLEPAARPGVDQGTTVVKAARPAAAGRRAATNAPRHWPPVMVDHWMPQMPFYNQLGIVAALVEGLEVGNVAGTQLALAQSFVYDDGVLGVPVLVDEGGQRTAVFVYPEAGPAASAHYCGVRIALRQREAVSAVYYAPQALVPQTPSAVVEDLDTSHFSKFDGERPPAEYALWFPTADDPVLLGSPALAHLDTWFEALDGYAHVFFSSLVEALGLATADQEEGKRVIYPLPVQPLMVPVDGPGGHVLYLHASCDEGVWFAFDVLKTTSAERNRLLSLLAGLATTTRRVIDREQLPPHREAQGRSLYFWRRARQDALDKAAAGEADVRLGVIAEAGVGRLRLVGASTAGERAEASARAQPSAALVDFARQQLDRAFAELGRHQEDGEGEVNEEPNLHPIVAVRQGTEVHWVRLHMFTEIEAVQTCPSVVEDFGEVDAVALVCDGIVRLDEERFDALRLRAQERGQAVGHVFVQRYRLAAGKPALLGNWLLQGNDAALLPPDHRPAEQTPSPAVAAFAQEILRTTLEWIRIGDESGSELYEEGRPLFSPSLYLRIGPETHTRRFMMGSEVWAEAASRDELKEASEAGLMVFSSDRVAERNGEPARALRFRAQERGSSASWIYEQRYEVPQAGRPFQTIGLLNLVRPAPSLFS